MRLCLALHVDLQRSIQPPTYPFTPMDASDHLAIRPTLRLLKHPSTPLPNYPSVHPPIYPGSHPPTHPFIHILHPPTHPSTYLPPTVLPCIYPFKLGVVVHSYGLSILEAGTEKNCCYLWSSLVFQMRLSFKKTQKGSLGSFYVLVSLKALGQNRGPNRNPRSSEPRF